MSYLSEHEVVVDLGVDITSIKDRNKYLQNIKKSETKKIEKKIKYSEEEILKLFLKKYELSSLIDTFKREKVFSFENLESLTENDLEKIGIKTLGDRKYILKLFNNEIENFKNDILYSEYSDEEKRNLKIKENEILKQNKVIFRIGNYKWEEGFLTLFLNRIHFKSAYNDFTISIKNIIDVSVEARAARSTLIIKDNNYIYRFTICNNSTINALAFGSLAGLNSIESVGLAMMNDKQITDIEIWRNKIEQLRQDQKNNSNNFAINEGCPNINLRKSNLGSIVITIFAITIIGMILFFYILDQTVFLGF